MRKNIMVCVSREAVDDWLDITTLTPETWAPRLNKSKTGRRSQHVQATLGKKEIERPQQGRRSLQHELRPHFAKGMEAVFIFRFCQLQRFYKGSQDLQRWIRRLQCLRQRIIDAWMDTCLTAPAANVDCQAALQAVNAQLQAEGLNAQQQQALLAGRHSPPIVLLLLKMFFGKINQSD